MPPRIILCVSASFAESLSIAWITSAYAASFSLSCGAIVRATLMSVAPSALVRLTRSTAHARPGAIRARGLPAITHPVSSPVVVFSSSRRFRVTISSIGSPCGRGVTVRAGFEFWETITRISNSLRLRPVEVTRGRSSGYLSAARTEKWTWPRRQFLLPALSNSCKVPTNAINI